MVFRIGRDSRRNWVSGDWASGIAELLLRSVIFLRLSTGAVPLRVDVSAWNAEGNGTGRGDARGRKRIGGDLQGEPIVFRPRYRPAGPVARFRLAERVSRAATPRRHINLERMLGERLTG